MKQSGVWGRIAARAVVILLLAGVVALICSPQIEGLVTGEISPVKSLFGILLKLLAIVAVVLPVYLAQRRG